MENNLSDRFFDKLTAVINNKELIKLVISNPKIKSSGINSIIITIAQLKRGYRLSFVYRYSTKDITKNYEFVEGVALIKKALVEDFSNGDLFCIKENISLVTTPSGKIKINTHEPTLQPVSAFRHDKVKDRLINTAGNIYLRELEITNANWEVRREMSDKFRQINRYIELIEPEIKELTKDFTIPQEYHIADMGSGKGYLTFALYDYLANTLGVIPMMTGVELREDLVKSCNIIAKKSGFNQLFFKTGTIQEVELQKIDILIALHACDTATDDAIYRGIKSNASLIVCAPCCHKQIRKELNVTNELSNITKFGILKERQAEIITDTIRALLLEAHGYKTKVFEFISTEHTPKNVMIVGRKISSMSPIFGKIMEDVATIKKIFGIERHHLEQALRGKE
jgi:hypothetical protein